MLERILAIRRLVSRVGARAHQPLVEYAARNQAVNFCDTHRAQVHICWDLDNTLVNSGALLRDGRTLTEAIIEADPVTNMIDFYDEVRTRLPHAGHFILSARSPSMQGDTMLWCRRHGVTVDEVGLCLVPRPAAKPKIWRRLARSAHLVIVDDLTFKHEEDRPSVYHDLVRHAESIALSYVGFQAISEIAADRTAISTIAQGVVGAIPAGINHHT